jgi:hypothetical protein
MLLTREADAGVSFHWLLSEYLRIERPQLTKPLPGTDLAISTELVRSIVALHTFDNDTAVTILDEQLCRPDTATCFSAIAEKHKYHGRNFAALP